MLVAMNFSANQFYATLMIDTLLMESYEGTYFINSITDPNEIDILIQNAMLNIDGEMEETFVGQTSLGIYQISSDTLIIAGNEPGSITRPIDFLPGENNEEGYYHSRVFQLIRQ